VIIFVGTLVYLLSYKKEAFKVEEALRKSSYKWWARHIGVGAATVTFFCSLILAVLSIFN